MKRKAGRVDRNDVKARAAAMRQKKAAAEAAKQKAAAEEEAKRQRSMMPPPPPMAPKQPKTLPSKKVTLPAEPAPPAPPAKPPAGLPPGFFDSAATSSEAPKSLVAYGSDDSDSDDAEEAPAAAAPAPAPAPAKAGELPAGFFDDKNADLKARGVDPEKAKAESEAKAWAEFSEFAGGVARDEVEEEASEAQENDDESRRRALDQAWYERRLAPLMARADGAKAPVVNDAAVARVGDADDGGVDIAAALAARERKDKEKAAAAAAMLPIDDDLSDDDLNEALWNQPRYTVPGFQKGQ